MVVFSKLSPILTQPGPSFLYEGPLYYIQDLGSHSGWKANLFKRSPGTVEPRAGDSGFGIMQHNQTT